MEVAFASQKRYIAFYILKQPVVDAYRGELVGLSVGKGCIRCPKPEKVDFTVITKLLREPVIRQNRHANSAAPLKRTCITSAGLRKSEKSALCYENEARTGGIYQAGAQMPNSLPSGSVN